MALLRSSTLQVAGNLWHIHPSHCIVLGPSWTQFQNVEFDNGPQKVKLSGTLSADPKTTLYLQLQDFAISNLNTFFKQKLVGVINASAALKGTLKQPLIDSELLLQDLAVDGLLIGHLQAHTHWNNPRQCLNLRLQVERLQKQIIAIQGFYTPAQQDHNLQLDVQLTHTPLALLTPFVKDQLSQLTGELNSTLHIQGSLAQPQLIGQASITAAAAKVDYLNTYYQFEGALTCTAKGIHLTTLNLTDDQQGKATFQGTIAYQKGKFPQADLRGTLESLQVLASTIQSRDYVYGTGIVNGELAITGPINNIAINAHARTAPGTEIFVALKQPKSTMVQKGFVQFVNFSAPTPVQARVAPPTVALKGLQLKLTLEITPEAQTEIILDSPTGDTIIRGKGKGNLNIILDTEGELSMVGDVAFTE
ncbi:MAG: translocation/assembly module TamB domain-containing protein, partial [Bacteroidota bacterium]